MLVFLACLAPFETRKVMGLNPYIKPMKFSASFAIALWTVAWIITYLPGPRRALAAIRWGIVAAAATGLACIALQAARGTTSHFNFATPFDTLIFMAMGATILANTVLTGMLLYLFLTEETSLPPAYLLGIQLGTAIFILGSLEGAAMLVRMAHTVGLPDGGPGLPLLNWSTRAGDLRIAHALGLHAFQILPLAGYGLSRWKGLSTERQIACLWTLTTVYAAATACLFLQAMQGRPIIAL